MKLHLNSLDPDCYLDLYHDRTVIDVNPLKISMKMFKMLSHNPKNDWIRPQT